MNHLAHAYLSFGDPEIITGNLIADFVKGRRQLALQEKAVQKGILIHRAIDTFTDQHPVTAKAKAYFRPAARLYSGVFTDLVMDHFLATDTSRFTDDSLYTFSRQVYKLIGERAGTLPPAFMEMFGYMKEYDWLYNYRYVEGIGRSLRGIARRAKYLETSGDVIYAAFMEHYDGLKACYEAFFPELEGYVRGISGHAKS
ncbi:Acyl carrier protein phosphodiesterase [Chitinophaga jiangningensis]|uniref:Acyl carrier protein phosphodiesterase n=1 Tax=Chitinophaga jiangningensis TaxID=1419482 RepID=A0A1M7E0L9_9BACT|nr:ACP phosphodiesterase [Chitinophaga jiangningensis]SHL85284.1 Acyl carrier protein phosphodiesterase [Chitinophaga jiangningensis]